MIASTDFDPQHAEVRTIVSVSRRSGNPRITLDSPLTYKHFAATESVGSDSNDYIEMRAEVGLLSRNIKFMSRASDVEVDGSEHGA